MEGDNRTMPHDAASRVPPWLHHALFVLFLLGILGYGGSFAFYMLTKFDLINLIQGPDRDDAYYYYEIAKNLAAGKFSTFDGITRTNGYHPLWLLLITPFYWICDPATALFGIKAFEIMLITGAVVLVVLAARVARLPWLLLFAALPMLLNRRPLMIGMEAAAALFTLGVLFLVLSLFARNPTRWQWPLAVTVFTLPWARLEYVAISMAATGALCLIEWSRRKEPPASVSLGAFISSLSSLRSLIPFAGACAGILSYFVYNGVVFGGLVPVSGAFKLIWAQHKWANSGYSFLQNFQDFLQMHAVGPGELVVALEVCAYLLVVWWVGRRSRRREDDLLLGFLVGVFSLGVGHLAQFMYAVLLMHPDVHGLSKLHSKWYYVPGYLLMALIVPVRCWVIVFCLRRLIASKWHQVANVASVGVLVIGMIVTFDKVNFTKPYLFVDRLSQSLGITWKVVGYAGARVMNRLLPEGSIVGSRDAGVIGYFSRFPVVELGGVVNSYEYLRSADRASLHRSYGITHFADVLPVVLPVEAPFSPSGKAVFEGLPFNPSGRYYEFKLRFADPPWASSREIDPAAWFWKRMEPHFAYQSQAGDVGVVIDGRLVLAFAKDCAPDEPPGRRLLLQWTPEAGETGSALQRPWRNEGEIPYVCGDASLLPKDRTHPLQIALQTEEDPAKPLGSFEEGLDDWRLDGDAVTIEGQHARTVAQQPVSGHVGGFLTSYHPTRGDAVTGTARSPAFTPADGQLLTFLIAGGDGDGVGVRLLADGAEVTVWRGRDTEYFEEVAYLLSGLAGQTLHLELFDTETGGWGHVMLDHVRLVQVDAAR